MKTPTRRRFFCALAALAVAALPLPIRADAASDVLAAGKNFAALTSWHAEESSQGQSIAVDFSAPDRFRIQTPAGTQYVIGSEMYVTVAGHTMKLAIPQVASMIAQFRSPGQAATFAKTHPVTDLGNSSVGGVATHAYGFDDTTEGITTHNVLDVGPKALPYRMTVNSNRGKAVIIYSKFNVPVTIAPPA
jgi:hypothetical protein